MICKRCGNEINTNNRRADGTIVCPSCGMIYRQKPAAKQAQISRSPREERQLFPRKARELRRRPDGKPKQEWK